MSPPASSKMALVTTSPYQVALFFEQQLRALPEWISPVIYSNAHDRYADLTKLDLAHIPIQRSSALTRSDLRAIVEIRRKIAADGISTVVTMSPKAGLVGQIAAATARVPNRLHIFTGQVWQGLDQGPARSVVRAADRTIGRLATNLAADSPSQAEFLRAEHVSPKGRVADVPHPAGSIRGVDINKFRPNAEVRAALRASYGLKDNDTAFVQLGRIAAAKGVVELVDAFVSVRKHWKRNGGSEPRLFIVGEDEEGLGTSLAAEDGVEVVPFTRRPEDLLAAMDVMVLASHREGFGSSIIEGAAAGLPSVGTDIVGVRDAIVDGDTGWLVPRRSTPDLRNCLQELLAEPNEVRRRGAAAQERAHELFDSVIVLKAWTDYLVQVHSQGDSTK